MKRFAIPYGDWLKEANWIKEVVAKLSPCQIRVVEEFDDRWPARLGQRFFEELSPSPRLAGYEDFLRGTKQRYISRRVRTEEYSPYDDED